MTRFPAVCWLLLFAFVARYGQASPAPRALPPATEQRLRSLLDAPEYAASHLGITIIALGTADNAASFPSHPYDDHTQPVLFDSDGGKRFIPASNCKLYTAAYALYKMGAERRLVTSVMLSHTSTKDEAELYLVGGGDPSFDEEGMRDLARQVAANGIKHVSSLVVRGNAFSAAQFGGRYPEGWTLDDAQWYYGPEVNALAYHRNQVDIIIQGGKSEGQPTSIRVEPALPKFKLGDGIEAHVITGGEQLRTMDEDDLLNFDRSDRVVAIGPSLRISGAVAPGQRLVQGAAVPDHDRWAGLAFKEDLKVCGVGVDGPLWVDRYGGFRVGTMTEDKKPLVSDTEVASYLSPPLRTLLQYMLKHSDNLYAEMLLRAPALFEPVVAAVDAESAPHYGMMTWLRTLGIDTAPLHFTDGSGLSRYDLITPKATAQLLAGIEKLPGGDAIWDALPIAGRDGTLKNRLKDTAAANNVRAKTGSFSIVSTLSGYVTTRDGQRLAVSLLTNFAPSTVAARRLQDGVFAALADASWRQ